jgi:hypothetical protein
MRTSGQACADIAPTGVREPLGDYRGTGDMAAPPLQLLSLMGLGGSAGVQGKPAGPRHIGGLLIRVRRRERRQRKGLLATKRSHGNPTGDGRPKQLIERRGARLLPPQVALLGIAHQLPAALEVAADAVSDALSTRVSFLR